MKPLWVKSALRYFKGNLGDILRRREDVADLYAPEVQIYAGFREIDVLGGKIVIFRKQISKKRIAGI